MVRPQDGLRPLPAVHVDPRATCSDVDLVPMKRESSWNTNSTLVGYDHTISWLHATELIHSQDVVCRVSEPVLISKGLAD